MLSRFSRGLCKRLPSLAVTSALIAIWEWTAQRGIYPPHLFPPPSAIFPALLGMIHSGQLWIDLKASGERWILGYCFGATFGIFAGLALGRSVPARPGGDQHDAADHRNAAENRGDGHRVRALRRGLEGPDVEHLLASREREAAQRKSHDAEDQQDQAGQRRNFPSQLPRSVAGPGSP